MRIVRNEQDRMICCAQGQCWHLVFNPIYDYLNIYCGTNTNGEVVWTGTDKGTWTSSSCRLTVAEWEAVRADPTTFLMELAL